MNFIMSSNAKSLSDAILTGAFAGKRSVTVEAEYGDILVPGSECSLAHHGPRAGAKAPCAYENGFIKDIDVVGLSHLDLDALGGCLAIMAKKPNADSFWRLAEFIDLNGAHKLGVAGGSEIDNARIHAWWAWNEEHKIYPPRDGSVMDVTPHVLEASDILEKIIAGDEELIAKGEAFRKREQELNDSSFIEWDGEVLVRVHKNFVNHMYTTPDGRVGKAVVAFNPVQGSITVSFADTPEHKNAREIVQQLFGPEAGGHAGIAGSPRGKRMTLKDLTAVVDEVAAQLPL